MSGRNYYLCFSNIGTRTRETTWHRYTLLPRLIYPALMVDMHLTKNASTSLWGDTLAISVSTLLKNFLEN